MHPNPMFRREPRAHLLAFAKERGFGVFTIVGSEGVVAAHAPFVVQEERVAAHLVRGNPVARALQGGPLSALLIVAGPDGYISPDWYGTDGRVPTWNYVAVHLRGTLRQIAQSEIRAHLDQLSANFEERLAPKPPWTTDQVDTAVLADLMQQIVPVAMTIESVEGTFKLNQNRTSRERAGATSALDGGATPGLDTRALATLMRARAATGDP